MFSSNPRFPVVRRQLWNIWSLKGLILLPIRYVNQLIYWRKRGLDTYLSPCESFWGTISVACMWKSLATLCLHLYQKSKPSRGLLGFHYNGQPAVLVNDPDVIQRLLQDSHNFEVLWQPDVVMNPILSKCPMFCTNLNWMHRDIWTQDRLDRAFNKLLKLPIISPHNSSFCSLMNETKEDVVYLRAMCIMFAQQVFVRVGLGLTHPTDQEFEDGNDIFETFVNAFETHGTEPRETLCLLAANIARNDKEVKIVNRKAEEEIRRLASTILNRDVIKAAGRMCLLHWLNDEGLSLENIVHHLYVFCFDLYLNLVCLGTFAMRELAEDAITQNQLAEALNTTEARDGGKWIARSILGLPLLQKFVNEMRRRYPPYGCIARICKVATILPVAPGSDKNLKLQPGDLVFASTLGVIRDYDEVHLTHASPNTPLMKLALTMLIATNLRSSRLVLGGDETNQKVEILYEAILPETALPLRAAIKPQNRRRMSLA